MSTETVYYATAKEIRAAELRHREAKAREAKRKAAQLKAEQQAKEAARRRIEAANIIIQQQEDLFQQEVTRLDEASQRLPDFSMRVAVLSTPDFPRNASPEDVEVYADTLRSEVSSFTHQLRAAIIGAEYLLQRRIEKAETWQKIKIMENNVEHRKQEIDNLAALLHVASEETILSQRPDTSAELEDVQMYLNSIKQFMDGLERQYSTLLSRQQSRQRSAELAGSYVDASNVEIVQKEHQVSLLARAKASLKKTMEDALNRYQISWEELPEDTRLLVEDAISHADASDKSEQVIRWIARARQHLDGTQKSLTMMQNAPEMIHDNKHLSDRWSQLVERLQRVAGGIDEFTPDVDREYQQISMDASRNVCTAYTKADWLCAMSEQGFDVLERKNEAGMVVVDLNNLSVWLEAEEIQSKEGDGFGVSMKLKTDTESSTEQESSITEDVCSRLKQVMSTATDKASTHSEVVSQTRRITRGKRPARKLKTFQQPL